MSTDRSPEWFDDFWENLSFCPTDDGTSAIRLLGELLDRGGLRRDGDLLIGRGGMEDALRLTTDDAHLIRRIEDTVNEANEIRRIEDTP